MTWMQMLAWLDFNQVEQWLAAGGYLVLFGLLFACGVGLPLPEDIPLLLAGFLISQKEGTPGKMHILPVAICAWLGIIGGDCLLYMFGKKYGLNITKVPFIGKHVTRRRIEKAERLYGEYGVWVVAVGRLFAGIRGAMVVAAGAIRFNFAKFIVADGLAALVSGGLWVWLGWWIGRKVPDVKTLKQHVEHYKGWILLGMIALGVIVIAWIVIRARRYKAEPADEEQAADGSAKATRDAML